MATPFLRITDGTTSATFLNSTTPQTYFIEAGEWAPAIAGLRKSDIGGVSPYDDVVEEINCLIRSTTAALCYAALETLALLLDQAERWSNGDNVTAVKIQFAPGGSTVSSDSAPLECVILGRDEGDETNGATLQPEWDGVAFAFTMPVRVKFKRRGLWLAAAESGVTSSSAANPSVLTATFASSHSMYSPIQLALNGFDGGIGTRASGYFLITRSADHLSIVEAEGLTATALTSVANSGANARGGNHLRFTPTGTGSIFSYNSTAETTIASGFRSGLQRFGVFIAARNNSSTANYYVRASAYYVDNLANLKSTNFVKIPAGATSPAIYSLGLISLPSAEKLYLDIWCDLVNQSCDIDYICLIRFDDECSKVVAHGIINAAVSGGGSTAVTYLFDDHSLDKPEPSLDINAPSVSQRYGMSYTGNPYIVNKGDTISFVHLTTQGAKWCDTIPAGTTISNTITATRRKAYLAPK